MSEFMTKLQGGLSGCYARLSNHFKRAAKHLSLMTRAGFKLLTQKLILHTCWVPNPLSHSSSVSNKYQVPAVT